MRFRFEHQQWQQIVDGIGPSSLQDADVAYYYGSALAQLGRWDEARGAFLAGRRLKPPDPRFPVELAGVAFKQKRYAEAARWLRRALRIDPADRYANDFLGTVYFLEGNQEAAIERWNRIGKPRIENVRQDHPLEIHPALLDRALTFAPASPLLLPELLTSRMRVQGLGVFASPKLQLEARDDGNFDVVLNLEERNRWGSGKWESLLSLFRGVAYQTVYPEYFNLGHSAMNITSLVRWDSQKRRLNVDVSAPLHQNPKWRYRVGVDLRRENWAIRDAIVGARPLEELILRREAGSAEITSFNSGRWGWAAGVELSERDYGMVTSSQSVSSSLGLEGLQLKQTMKIHYQVWRDPEHRLAVDSGMSSQLARIRSAPSTTYAKLDGSLAAHWLPHAEGDDFETQIQVRAGGTAGRSPFDELYMVGLERDNDLWMRGHIGTRDGQKGNAPLGTRYFLINSETDKNVYGNGLLSVKLGPFLDVGKVWDPSGQLGSHKVLWDTGLQTKMKVLGVGLIFSWGRDLRTGNNAFYFTTAGSRPSPD